MKTKLKQPVPLVQKQCNIFSNSLSLIPPCPRRPRTPRAQPGRGAALVAGTVGVGINVALSVASPSVDPARVGSHRTRQAGGTSCASWVVFFSGCVTHLCNTRNWVGDTTQRTWSERFLPTTSPSSPSLCHPPCNQLFVNELLCAKQAPPS